MGNEYTKSQIRAWLDNAVKKAQSPDPREKLKRERQLKSKKVANRFGL